MFDCDKLVDKKLCCLHKYFYMKILIMVKRVPILKNIKHYLKYAK